MVSLHEIIGFPSPSLKRSINYAEESLDFSWHDFLTPQDEPAFTPVLERLRFIQERLAEPGHPTVDSLVAALAELPDDPIYTGSIVRLQAFDDFFTSIDGLLALATNGVEHYITQEAVEQRLLGAIPPEARAILTQVRGTIPEITTASREFIKGNISQVQAISKEILTKLEPIARELLEKCKYATTALRELLTDSPDSYHLLREKLRDLIKPAGK